MASRKVSMLFQSAVPRATAISTAPLRTFVTVGRALHLQGYKVGQAQISARFFKTYKNKPSPNPMKVKSGVKKRFRVTGGGRLKYKHAGVSHNLGSKSQERKRRLHKKVVSINALM